MHYKSKKFKNLRLRKENRSTSRYEEWKRTIDSKEFKSIKEYIKDYDKFKYIFKVYNGNLDKVNDIKYSNMKKRLETIDRLIKHDVNRLNHPRNIFIGLDPHDLGITLRVESMNDTPTTLNRIACSNILNYKFGRLLGLKVGNLTKNIRKDDKIMLKINLPTGSYLGCFYSNGEEKAIMPLNSCVEIKDRKITVFKGREIIYLKGVLRENDFVNKKIRNVEKRISNKFIDFDKENDFVSLDFNKGFESYGVKFAEIAINSLISNFPKNKRLYADVIKDIKKIKFTDDKIPIPTGRETSGWFDQYNNILYIKPTSSRFILNFDKSVDAKTEILHEIAHAIDEMHINFSLNARFNKLYEEEIGAVMKNDYITSEGYAGRNISEYFAEIFKAMYSPYKKQRKAVRKSAPKSVKFIEEKIKEYT